MRILFFLATIVDKSNLPDVFYPESFEFRNKRMVQLTQISLCTRENRVYEKLRMSLVSSSGEIQVSFGENNATRIPGVCKKLCAVNPTVRAELEL